MVPTFGEAQKGSGSEPFLRSKNLTERASTVERKGCEARLCSRTGRGPEQGSAGEQEASRSKLLLRAVTVRGFAA